jgi:hypothetical protein
MAASFIQEGRPTGRCELAMTPVGRLIFLLAKRSNLGRTLPPPVEIASSPAAPRNDSSCRGSFFLDKWENPTLVPTLIVGNIFVDVKQIQYLNTRCEAPGDRR